jgi:hypothetical protein
VCSYVGSSGPRRVAASRAMLKNSVLLAGECDGELDPLDSGYNVRDERRVQSHLQRHHGVSKLKASQMRKSTYVAELCFQTIEYPHKRNSALSRYSRIHWNSLSFVGSAILFSNLKYIETARQAPGSQLYPIFRSVYHPIFVGSFTIDA